MSSAHGELRIGDAEVKDVFICDNPGCRRRYEDVLAVGEAWLDLGQHKGTEFMVRPGDECPACRARGGRIGHLRSEESPAEE